jgi:uracil-DNA glycosylase
MYRAELAHPADLDGFRNAVRRALALAIAPVDIDWAVAGSEGSLALASPLPECPEAIPPRVPRRFAELAELVICNREPGRFRMLHQALLRLQAMPRLLEDRSDALVDRLEDLAKSVSRDRHKMRAFLRFREVKEAEGPHFIAWFEPDHHILRLNCGFFIRRYASQRWTILTPEASAHWDGRALHMLPGAAKADAPESDPLEEIWKTYYASTFNPARLKVKAMQAEMPQKYWKNLPEAALIPDLIAGAEARMAAMIGPDGTDGQADTIDALRALAATCRRCPLHGPATQTVFGEGPRDARLMIVGEQPGDQEDLQGRPFVGPAGAMLDKALKEAGIDRSRAYVTNAVKHFKFQLRGKRRIHESPNAAEIQACRWWLDQERTLLRPGLVLMLGASAGRALMGRVVAVGKERGKPLSLPDGAPAFLTVHPSYLLRIENAATARAEYSRFVEDLRAARSLAEER